MSCSKEIKFNFDKAFDTIVVKEGTTLNFLKEYFQYHYYLWNVMVIDYDGTFKGWINRYNFLNQTKRNKQSTLDKTITKFEHYSPHDTPRSIISSIRDSDNIECRPDLDQKNRIIGLSWYHQYTNRRIPGYTPIFYRDGKPFQAEPIVLLGPPKTASSYTFNVLRRFLNGMRPRSANIEPYSGTVFYVDENSTDLNNLSKAFFYGTPFKTHNLDLILNLYRNFKFKNKIVITLRHPKQVFLSWIHYRNKKNKIIKDRASNPIHTFCTNPLMNNSKEISENNDPFIVLESLLEGNLYDYNGSTNFLNNIILDKDLIKSRYTYFVNLIKQYIDIADNMKSINILLTTFEEFKQDEDAYFKKILSFYDIPINQINNYKTNLNPEEYTRAFKFRKGLNDEWKTVIPSYINSYMDQIAPIPQNWKDRFGWE